MTLDFTFYLLAIPAVIIAGISKGGFGSGAAFVAAPILAMVIPPAMAVGLMLPLLMLIDAFALKPYWGKWADRESWLLIIGGLPGVALGALLWRFANADMLRFIIGAIAIGFVVSFFAAVVVVRWLLDYVSSHGFGLFAWWRIVVGFLGLAGLYIVG